MKSKSDRLRLAACRQRSGNVVVINPAKETGLVRFALPKSLRSIVKGGDEIASTYLQLAFGSDNALLKEFAKSVIKARATDDDFIDTNSEDFSAFAQISTQRQRTKSRAVLA